MDAFASTRSTPQAGPCRSLRVAAPLFALSVIGASLLPGCENDPSAPYAPVATLENVWPNDDGRAWTFESTEHRWDSTYDPQLYASPQFVPPAPSLDVVEQLVREPPPGNAQTTQGIYRLQFNGMLTTESGATGQNLVDTYESASAGKTNGPAAARPNAAFLARLLRARPDLANRIAAAAPWATGDALDQTRFLVAFLHGGAWAKSDQWIGSYGDLDTRLAWKYLESNLSRGHEFTHQLVPAIDDDAFLHCRVQRRLTWNTNLGSHRNAIECLYLIDYGVTHATGQDGLPTGYWRDIDYGVVVYAPEVGPVYCYERVGVTVGETLGPGIGDVTLELASTGVAPATDAALAPGQGHIWSAMWRTSSSVYAAKMNGSVSR